MRERSPYFVVQLLDLLKVKDGWNARGSTAPSEKAIRDAAVTLEVLLMNTVNVKRVSPDGDGGATIVVQEGDREIFLCHFNDGDYFACSFYGDDSMDKAEEGFKGPDFVSYFMEFVDSERSVSA